MKKRSLCLHGAARGVTGSAHELGSETVLVDCGAFQGERDAAERNREPPIRDVATLGTVVLTHGHLDHVGRLPVLVRRGYRGPIFGHTATLAIAEIVLRDAARVGALEGGAAYGDEDVDAAAALFCGLPYGAKLHVGDGLDLTLFDAGHILGSASVLLEWRDTSILLSGDLGRRGTPILRDPNTSYPAFTRVDHVVIEATYGDREHAARASIQDRLRWILRRALDDGGKVLVPAFSIGRTQELIYHLRALTAEGELAGVPVVVDGPMGLDVTALYERFPDAYDGDATALLEAGRKPLSFDELYGARTRKASERAKTIDGPAVVIAGSGMCTGGRIMHHLRHNLPIPETAVLIVGFQSQGTLGRKLVDGAKSLMMFGEEVPVRASIHTMGGFSAHADQSGLLDWYEVMAPSRPRTIITHGEDRARKAFSEQIQQRFGVKTECPTLDDVVEI